MRIKAGHSKEQIQTEMLEIGYDSEAFLSAYSEAEESTTRDAFNENFTKELTDATNEVHGSQTLSNLNHLIFEASRLFKDTIKILTKGIITLIAALILTGLVGISLIAFFPVVGTGSYLAKFMAMFFFLTFFFVVTTTCLATVVRSLLRRTEKQRHSKHFRWTFLNIINIILVSFYVNLITQLGMTFFIIPGIMLSVYLIFASYFVMGGEMNGVAALVSSTKLVYGRFWTVFWRVLVSVFFLTLVTAVAVSFLSTLALLKPFFVPTVILLIIVTIISALYWQLCFMIILFESLKKISVVEELPTTEKKLTYIFRGIIIFSIVAAIGIFNINEPDEHRMNSPWTYRQITNDVNHKSMVKAASNIATTYIDEKGSYLGFCEEITLPENSICKSTEVSFVIETPMSWGYYCYDSTGYNEVRRRPVAKGELCQTADN